MLGLKLIHVSKTGPWRLNRVIMVCQWWSEYKYIHKEYDISAKINPFSHGLLSLDNIAKPMVPSHDNHGKTLFRLIFTAYQIFRRRHFTVYRIQHLVKFNTPAVETMISGSHFTNIQVRVLNAMLFYLLSIYNTESLYSYSYIFLFLVSVWLTEL